MPPRIADRTLCPSSYEEAEALGLIRDGEFAKCPVCGCERIKHEHESYEEFHGWFVAEYTAVCGGCGEELGIYDHGAIFPAYL